LRKDALGARFAIATAVVSKGSPVRPRRPHPALQAFAADGIEQA
jgi:hypothetical protein